MKSFIRQRERMQTHWMSHQKAPYAIKEAALIFEAGSGSYFDYMIGVTAPESLRISE